MPLLRSALLRSQRVSLRRLHPMHFHRRLFASIAGKWLLFSIGDEATFMLTIMAAHNSRFNGAA